MSMQHGSRKYRVQTAIYELNICAKVVMYLQDKPKKYEWVGCVIINGDLPLEKKVVLKKYKYSD